MNIVYHDFSNSKFIAFDTETKDPTLKEFGAGTFMGNGDVIGFSLADESGFSEYYNTGHPDCTPAERKKNLAYLKEVMALPQPKVGVNTQYDVDWITNGLGIRIAGELLDCAIAEALLDENLESYSLDSIAFKYLNKRKASSRPQEICIANKWEGDFRKHLWRMNYPDVRAYGKADALYPIKIIQVQLVLMAAQDLMPVFEMEGKITQILIEMRRNGVRIDTVLRDKHSAELKSAIASRKKAIYAQYGEFNFNSSKQIAVVLDSLGAPYKRKEKTGNPILDGHAMKALSGDYPVCKGITELKKIDKILGTFIDGSLTKAICPDGRIHATFYNTKTEREGGLAGTRSGRFSCSSPNLQQIPSYDAKEANEFKKWYTSVCRELFIPEEDHWWLKIDYSQIEYRFMAHFACNAGPLDTSAEDVRKTYNDDPHTDYHQMIQDLTGLPRKLAKNLNFGVGYGMGKGHMSEFFGWEADYCDEVLHTYHSRAPFVKATMNAVSARARAQGFIRTFMNRRSRLTDPRKAYIMFCRLCQGSAADLTKKAMVDAWDAGLFNILPIHLTVHDEIDCSMPKTRVGIEAGAELRHIMETALTLRVPIIAEAEYGSNWIDLKPFDAKSMLKEIGA